jgi:predicted transcriptional regulator
MYSNLIELTSDIIKVQLSHSSMGVDEISDAIKKVYRALKWVKEKEEIPERLKESKAEIKGMDSIKRSRVICLECMKEFRQLTGRHLSQHGLTPRQYKKKHGIPLRQGLSARVLTLKRRIMAKERGLGERLSKARQKGNKVQGL